MAAAFLIPALLAASWTCAREAPNPAPLPPRLEGRAHGPAAALPLEPLTGILPAAAPAAAIPALRDLNVELQAAAPADMQAQSALNRTFEGSARADDGAAPAQAVAAFAWIRSARHPTWPLRPATAAPDASFLVQRAYGYKDSPEFTRPMAQAIAQTTEYLRQALAAGEKVSTHAVRDRMERVARARRQIAQAANHPHWRNFGNPIPEDQASMARFDPGEDSDAQPWSSWSELTIGDLLKNDPADRHFPYYQKASRFERSLGSLRTIVIDGQTFPISRVQRFSQSEKLHLVHPSFKEMVPMRRAAFMILADAISDPKITEAAFMDRLAAAYRLLVHATPWVRGSPSIIEAFYDAALRAKFGKTLPPKTDEPFWDAALRDPRRPYTGRDFLKNFGGA